MEFIRRYKWILIGGGVALAVIAFLAFRPDKLFVDDVVDESLSDAFATTTSTTQDPPATTTTTVNPASETTAPTTTTSSSASSTTTEPASSEPIELTTGGFYGIDHSAQGTATIYELEGQHVLRFEDDTDIQNGPDLYVWVLADEDYEGGSPTDYIDLGKIKGNVGGQNYELPAEFDPDVHRSVLIWCLRFSVPFAAAPLA